MKTMYYKAKNLINGRDDSLDAFWEYASSADEEDLFAITEQIEADLTLNGINGFGWVSNITYIPRWAFWRQY